MQESIPKIGIAIPKGALNGLSLLGSLTLKIIIPTQTKIKAKRVPMFVKSTIISMLENADVAATAMPVRIVVTWGVLNLG